MTDMETRYKNLLSTEIAGVKASYKKESKEERKEAEQEKFNDITKMFLQNDMFRGWWKGYLRLRMLRMLSERNVILSKIKEERSMDKDINDYQVARSRRADDEIVSRL